MIGVRVQARRFVAVTQHSFAAERAKDAEVAETLVDRRQVVDDVHGQSLRQVNLTGNGSSDKIELTT